MACGQGMPTPDDCAVHCWSPAVGGRREGQGWRAPCPACHAARALEYSIRGKSIWWNSFCSAHGREVLRPVLRELLGPCMPGRVRRPVPVRHDDLAELALSGLQPQAIRVRLLELSGLSTDAAMDKLGVERANRYKIRMQLWSFGHIAADQ